MDRLLIRCDSATIECPDAQALLFNVNRMTVSLPIREVLTAEYQRAYFSALARADQLQAFHDQARGMSDGQ